LLEVETSNELTADKEWLSACFYLKSKFNRCTDVLSQAKQKKHGTKPIQHRITFKSQVTTECFTSDPKKV